MVLPYAPQRRPVAPGIGGVYLNTIESEEVNNTESNPASSYGGSMVT